MMKKASSAALVAKQSRRRAAESGTLKRFNSNRVELVIHPETKVEQLFAVFPRDCGLECRRNNISFLLEFKNLRPIFEEGLLRSGANKSVVTRAEGCRVLNRTFFSFLRETNSRLISSCDIDDDFLLSFKYWLKKSCKEGNLNPSSISKGLGRLRGVFSAIKSGEFHAEALRIAERIPPSGVKRNRFDPTKTISMDNLVSIIECAEKEIVEIEAYWEHGKRLVKEGQAKLIDPLRMEKGNRGDFRDLSICLAKVDEIFPGEIPELEEIRKINRSLGSAILSIHSMGNVVRYFQPNPRDMVPFVLLLAISCVFNPDTVLTLERALIDFNRDQSGTPAIEIIGSKGRASADLVRLLEAESSVSRDLSLKRILLMLDEICARIRSSAPRDHSDRLFIFVPERAGDRSTKGFGSRNGGNENASADMGWRNSLERFINQNKLKKFTLGQLRPTILEMVQLMDGGLEAAQKVGNHRHPGTTWTHYTSSAIRSRYREKVGQIIMLRERWYNTKGDIDPRRLEPGHDKGAATPGFICLDPLSSPRPNQLGGKLCTDYGGCPACPLSGARPHDPVSVAYYYALDRAIFKSQPNMSAQTWIERWGPVLADLRELLTLVPSEIAEQSNKFKISLPMVG
ncbi:hypothetical protein JAB1_49850 [Janthinobacterium sp. MP5059B]|uniref:hypothetical protein n=1 Tax=Janthinobacterium sp. MP5059B TaxID=1766683 RepID=UPI00089396E8|nr:hypothetical protein [Janthinobacterium sp. MP5059B]OEZ46503.1 hypothetical protein JAB1_49850 [Janthinobacterium sp. MP5059B]